jgi:hypothetical protein
MLPLDKTPIIFQRRTTMKLSEPKVVTFIIALVIAILAVLGAFIKIPFITGYTFWVFLAAFILLALGNLIKGL